MPDVSRSDSQRSDSSRPRVSFNRDVHVKRIGTPGTPRVIGALAGDGEGHLVPLPVRRERPTRLSRRELAKEAKRVLAQADSVVCSSQTLFDQPQKENKNAVNSNTKFSTLPPLRQKNKNIYRNKGNHSLGEESPSSSVERKSVKSSKRSAKTEELSLYKQSPASSLDRKAIKRSGGKNIVASVLSSLDRSVAKKKKHAAADRDTDSFKYSGKNSSLNDLTDNSSSSLDRSKRHRISLKRSVSDAGSRKHSKNNFKNKISGVFLSLDRLTAKQNRSKIKPLETHSDYSDRSSPRPRKNILKKSYSDTESASQIAVEGRSHLLHGEGHKKKQLSPIIEAIPREDYFHKINSTHDPERTDTGKDNTMLHSSQLPTQKPPLTRGHTVDAMVKRLSQDFNQSRGPPRVVNSAPGLITPEHRQHNNNLPFSYTKPTTHQYVSSTPTEEPTRNGPLNDEPTAATRAPTTVDGQVIYAEVVVSGGGGSGGAVSKQTVHTKVLPLAQAQLEEPIQPKIHARQLEKTHFRQAHESFPSEAVTKESSPFQRHKVRVKVTDQRSEEDEGIGLTMENGGYRHKTMGYREEGNSSGRKGVMDSHSGGNSYTTAERFVEKRIINGEEERSCLQNSSRREIRTDYGGNNGRKEYSVHESRYESENYIADPSVRGRADGMDSKKKDFIMSENYNSGGVHDNGFYYNHNGKPKDGVRRNLFGDYTENGTYKPEFYSEGRIISLNETDGARRELLSRGIDSSDLSSRRDRLESRIESQRKDRFVCNKYSDVGYGGDHLDTINEINRKYATDTTFNTRHDFLNSQLDYDRNPTLRETERQETDKNYGLKSSRYFETTTTKTEVDSYGKKDLFADSGIEVDYRAKDSSKNNRKYDERQGHDTKVPANNHHMQNMRTELRDHPYDRLSDYDDDTRVDENLHNHMSSSHCSNTSNHHKTTLANTFTSTKLVQGQKQNEVIPSSTVIIRHWVPQNKEDASDSKNKYTQVLKPRPEKIKQPSLSDDEEYEKSRKADEYRTPPAEEYRKTDDKEKASDEKEQRSAEIKVTRKKHSSTIDKMRQLFTRSDKSAKKNKKKEEKVKVGVEEDEAIDPLTSRYTEYRGSDTDVHKESPRTVHQDRGHMRSSNVEDDQHETSRPADKNGRSSERASPKDRRYLDQESAYQSSHNGRSHYTRMSNMELDKSITRPSNQDGSRGQLSGLEEHKEPKREEFNRSNRQRLATPSPSPSPIPPQANNKSTAATLTRINNMKNRDQNSNGSGGWFKSLDRLTKRGKNRVKEHDKDVNIITEDDSKTIKQNNNHSTNNKNLRFFGDTDQESVSSTLQQSNHQTLRHYKSNGTSSTNGTRNVSHNRLQVPARNSGGLGLRHYRSAGDVATSSAESTTEGDSSQQSQRSVVYLHAATVGDIPGPPRSQRSGVTRRAQSREELSSTGASSHLLQPQSRTVSRSISVLAPWKPRHYKEGLEVHYDNEENGSKTTGRNDNGKPPKVPVSQHSSGNLSTIRSGGVNRHKFNGERSKETHTSPHKQTGNKSTSTESLGQKTGTNQGQYNRDRTAAEKKYSALHSSTSAESLNPRQNRDRSANSKKHSALNSSAAELNGSRTYRTATKTGAEEGTKRNSAQLSRSASMPKDSRLAAGWFKLRNKKQGM